MFELKRKLTIRNVMGAWIVAALLYSIITLGDHPGMIDTRYYTDAAIRLTEGQSLYARGLGQPYGYMYGPLFAYAIAWVMQLVDGVQTIYQITWVTQHLFWAILGTLFVSQTKGHNMRVLVAMTYLLSLPFRYGLEYGNFQVVIDTVLISAPMLVQAASKPDATHVGLKRAVAGILLGIMAAIKISPVFLIAVFLGGGVVHCVRTRQFDEWFKTGALAMVVFTLCMLLTPFHHTVEFFTELSRVSALTSQDGLPPTSVQYALTRLLNIDEPVGRHIIRCTAMLVLGLSCLHRNSMVRTLAAYWTIMVVNPFAWPYTVGLMLYTIVMITHRYTDLRVQDFRPVLASVTVVIVAAALIGYDIFYQLSSVLVDEPMTSHVLKLIGTIPINSLALVAVVVPKVLVVAEGSTPSPVAR